MRKYAENGKHKKINFNKRKEVNSARGKNDYFQETVKRRKKKREKLSGFVMLSEVLTISHERDTKGLQN